jgi:REP element-mobilizing transposase RayT
MPRSPRPELAGAIHHVYSRGAVRQSIFADDLDRRRYLATLTRVIRHTSWRCLTYCLMSNHMHLLIETPEPNLGRGMQRLHGPYAQAFNRRHEKAGHAFEARFGSNRIENDAQLWVTIAYIVRNPVEAGLCTAPDEWPWSSHRAISAGVVEPWVDAPRLLSFFATQGGDPHRRYLEFIAAEPKGVRPL